jgi:ATP-dependent helicase/nuclease subunit B
MNEKPLIGTMFGSVFGSGPRVYNIPSGYCFADQLALGLAQLFGDDPFGYSELTILLPTRRAIRALSESFLRLNEGKPVLLPQMRPIGDIDGDDSLFALDSNAAFDQFNFLQDIPGAINATERRMLLMRLILKAHTLGDNTPYSPAEALKLADELARLLDQTQIEEKDFRDLGDLVPDDLALHWQKTLTFLEIITKAWPRILADSGLMDPAEHRKILIDQYGESLKSNPPKGPVLLAGSTGTMPATARLMGIVARLPLGAVILPGYDTTLEDKAWEALDAESSDLAETHPQFAFRQLFARMKINRHEIRDWPFVPDPSPALTERSKFLTMALWPANMVPRWKGAAGFDVMLATTGLSLVEAPGLREEAGAIAVIMRHTLETPGKTAALVTPDRALAQSVQAELKRWDLHADDTAGAPLAETPSAIFMRLIIAAIGEGFSPLSLMAMLKHPFCSAGGNRLALLRFARQLEVSVLRGPRPGKTLAAIKNVLLSKARRLKDPRHTAAKARLLGLVGPLDTLAASLKPLIGLFKKKELRLGDAVDALLEAAEALATSDQDEGAAVLWAGDNGAAMARFFAGLDQPDIRAITINTHQFAGLFGALMGPHVVRSVADRHPRLAIWGTLEARMQTADVMILGGMNEGSWPPMPSSDPWMSRPMKRDFGLPLAELRIGLSAHDFVEAAAAGEVILTRSLKIDGTPTVKSRWLARMAALLGKPLPAGSTPWLAYYQALDKPLGPLMPAPPPRPIPPVSARPTKLSVTGIQNWMQDPYAIYARYILKLRPLEPLDEEPGAAGRGTIIHQALDTFVKSKNGAPIKQSDLPQLLAEGEEAFKDVLEQPAVWAFWWPRFEQVAEAFINEQAKRQRSCKIVATEVKGEMSLNAGEYEFTLSATADRIDFNDGDKAFQVIDYKTGATPSIKQISAGYAPQLPLEGLMIEHGAFEGLAKGSVDGLEYWKVTGGKIPLKIEDMKSLDVASEIAKAEQGLKNLVVRFNDPATPYLSKPRPQPRVMGYGDYDHLARVREWLNKSDRQSERQSSRKSGEAEP